MPDGRIAERMLSLVLPPERAAAIAGDLLEEAEHQGAVWFWLTVFRTMAAFIVRSVDWSVFSMAMAAGFAWLLYIPISMLARGVLSVFFTVVFGLAYFLTHHTIVELAIRIPLLRFDWPPMLWVPQATAAFIMMAWAPWHVGRFVARGRPGQELLAGLVAASAWPLMVAALPFVGRPARLGSWAIPVILATVIAGALAERRRASSVAPVTPASS